MLKLYKNDLNYLNMFFRGETLDHYNFKWDALGDSLLGNVFFTGDTV